MIKKDRVIIAIIVAIAIIAIGGYLFLNRQAENSFSVAEKKWIEDNKNQVIDIAVLNDLPYFGVNGEGVFFSFIADLEEVTGLSFNKIPYNIGEKPLSNELVFEVKTNEKDSELNFYNDSYVILGADTIFDLSELNGEKVGVLKDDINLAEYYLKDVDLVSYENKNSLFDAYDSDKLSYILVSDLVNAQRIITEDRTIAYRLSDITNQYVLTLDSSENKLNSIISKYFNIWIAEDFNFELEKSFVDFYFDNKEIDDQTKTSLLSKKYVYGYVNNLPYEKYVEDELVGLNSKYLYNFSALTDVEFVMEKYDSVSKLRAAFDKGEVDIMFNYGALTYEDNITTTDVYSNDYVVLVHEDSVLVVDSLNSLDDENVITLNGFAFKTYLADNSKAEVKTYSNMDDLVKHFSKKNVVVVPEVVYDYYKAEAFGNYLITYKGEIENNYNFVLSNDESNLVFSEMFDYFIGTVNKRAYYTVAYSELLNYKFQPSFLNLIVRYITYFAIGFAAILYVLFRLMRTKKVKKQIKKEDKLKFVDMLTSLKNRNYLTYTMPKWDDNNVYPQAIIIVDLNSIQYINDNFGHEEGDQVIVSAANILINNQKENSDIVRTDGNEFLIYLVGYSESEIIAYIRKLNKQLKNLEHGFGAALGYSVIKDEITTIDDAINEATLDMRTNKENIQD